MAETREMVVEYASRDGQQIKLTFDSVRRYLVSGKPEFVTDQEIVMYIGTCKARGLNPFKKDCYLVKYTERDPAATIVAIDYFRARAKAQPDCVGWKTGVIIKQEAELEFREGCFLLPGEKLVGGWFKAKPKHWESEFTWTVSLTGYIKRNREGQITQFWRDENQAYMITKVAESQGLHRLWPDEFQGLQLDDEFHALRDVTQAAEPVKVPMSKKEIPANVEAKSDGNKSAPKPDHGNGDQSKPAKSKAKNNDGDIDDPRRRDAKAGSASKEGSAAEKTQEDLVAECLLWCENASDAEIVEENNWLMGQLKKIKGTSAQVSILKPFNQRRQSLAKG